MKRRPGSSRIPRYPMCPHVLRHASPASRTILASPVTIAAIVGHAKGSLDTALIMAADTISGYIQELLDGIEFKQTAYAGFTKSRTGPLPEEGFGRRSRGEREERRLVA
ncbi:hypothetical protein ACVWXO_004470 [Bradyrhizobium sp. LM2.7]